MATRRSVKETKRSCYDSVSSLDNSIISLNSLDSNKHSTCSSGISQDCKSVSILSIHSMITLSSSNTHKAQKVIYEEVTTRPCSCIAF